jgi:alkanesulfonate monooxygenase SsuD/methylene tetrahydromethanopterin reductase-like flavin-dependent oxidoreductase (luciferase family)
VSHPLRFGVFVPQGWKLEYTGWSGPDAWARSVELAQLAEELGYDHLWVYDHVETVPRREPTHCFEAYTMLAALSQRTTTVGWASWSPAPPTATPDCWPRRRPASTSTRAAG